MVCAQHYGTEVLLEIIRLVLLTSLPTRFNMEPIVFSDISAVVACEGCCRIIFGGEYDDEIV